MSCVNKENDQTVMQRVGLYGGTFDPVHLGHIQLLLAAQREAELDKILVIPAAVPPHKSTGSIAPFADRVAMLRQALARYDTVEICSIEETLPKPSFTIDTVKALQEERGGAEQFFFIIGSDAFAAICTWKSYTELLSKVSLLVGQREGEASIIKHSSLRTRLGYEIEDRCWVHSEMRYKEIRFLKKRFPGWSSSQIREAVIAGGKQVAGLEPAVQAYIARNALYRQEGTGV